MNPSYWNTFYTKPSKGLPEPESLDLQPGGPPTAKPAWFKPHSRKSLDMDILHNLFQANLATRYSLADVVNLTALPENRVKAACKSLCQMGLALRTDEQTLVGKKFVKVIYVQGRSPQSKLRKGSWTK